MLISRPGLTEKDQTSMSTMSSHVRPPPKNASFLQRFKERFTRSATPSSLNLRSNEYKRSPQARESSPASPTVRHMKSTPTLRGNLMPTPGPSSPREATETTQQRRAAALRACGLLEQSRIYGNGQYSDEEALIKFDGEDGDKKLIYDEVCLSSSHHDIRAYLDYEYRMARKSYSCRPARSIVL